jgi:hypothetical protein
MAWRDLTTLRPAIKPRRRIRGMPIPTPTPIPVFADTVRELPFAEAVGGAVATTVGGEEDEDDFAVMLK